MPDLTAHDIFRGQPLLPVDEAPPRTTMAGKLIINVMPTGSFITRAQNPSQPYTVEEIAEEVVESYEAGAAMWHVHVRHDDGVPDKDPEAYLRVMDKVFAHCPDILVSINVIANYSAQGLGTIQPLVDALVAAGPKYIDTCVLHTTPTQARTHVDMMNAEVLQERVAYLQERGVKPELQCRNLGAVDNVKHWLIAPGILRRPYMFNIDGNKFMADPFDDLPDPWGFIHATTRWQQLPEGSAGGTSIGGRNWLPLTVYGIMLGAAHVRVGKEETVWMYPHRDEKIRRNADVVRKVATIARELGREIATPAEARAILGLTEKPAWRKAGA